MVLTASGNLLEGKLPGSISSELAMLDLSGVPGRSGGMNGPLPQALCQALSLPWSLRPRNRAAAVTCGRGHCELPVILRVAAPHIASG